MVLAPGATIRDSMVFVIGIKIKIYILVINFKSAGSRVYFIHLFIAFELVDVLKYNLIIKLIEVINHSSLDSLVTNHFITAVLEGNPLFNSKARESPLSNGPH